MNPYGSLCDDFGVYSYLNTKMELPAGRETVLHFFDSLRKTYPQMTDFDCRENGEFVLEEDREQGSYRWVTLESLLQVPGTRILNYEPALMLSLDEACRLQCRLNIETRTNPYQVRTGQFPEAPISVYFSVRQFWGRQPFKTFIESYRNQRRICQELVDSHIISAVVQPLAQTIAAKQ